MSDLAIPHGADPRQLAMAQKAMEQNALALSQQGRVHAMAMAVNLAAAVPEHAPITKVLTNARRIAHFIETGQAPTEAKS